MNVCGTKIHAMSIGKRIEELRAGMSRKMFAQRIDIAENTLRNYEQNLSLPNSDVIATICDRLSVNVEWLVTGKGEKHAGTMTHDAVPVAGAFTRQDAGTSILLHDIAERAEELQRQDLAALAKAKEEEAEAYRRKAQALGEATEALASVVQVQKDTIQDMQARIKYYETLLPHMGSNPFGAPKAAEEAAPPPVLQAGQNQKSK